MSSQVMLINNPSSYSPSYLEDGHQSELTESCDSYLHIPAVARELWDPTSLESLARAFATPPASKNAVNTSVQRSCSTGRAEGHGDRTNGVERQVCFILWALNFVQRSEVEYETDRRMVWVWSVIAKLLDEVKCYRCQRRRELWLSIIEGIGRAHV